MSLPKIILTIGLHRDALVVRLDFSKNERLQQILRVYKTLRWSQSMNCWYIPYSPALISDLPLLLRGHALLDDTALADFQAIEMFPVNNHSKKTNGILTVLTEERELKLTQFKSWMRSRRYSESTISTYTDSLRTFLRFFPNKPVSKITHNDVIAFNNEYILKNKLSASFQNQVVNAVKLFFSTVEIRSMQLELIHRPKQEHALPNVLSKEEVKLILNAHHNIKHRAMLSLINSCGLRCGELLRLKPEHIDSKRGLLIIKQAKGRKVRIAPLSLKIIELLRTYYAACKPRVYLFEGQNPGNPYDERSLQKVLKQSLLKVGIAKPVSLHRLRHSYATHLLESGTDLRYIQTLPGHRAVKQQKYIPTLAPKVFKTSYLPLTICEKRLYL